MAFSNRVVARTENLPYFVIKRNDHFIAVGISGRDHPTIAGTYLWHVSLIFNRLAQPIE